VLRFTKKSWVNEVLLQLCVSRLPGLEVSHNGPDMGCGNLCPLRRRTELSEAHSQFYGDWLDCV
jgi:hypothetical protein